MRVISRPTEVLLTSQAALRSMAFVCLFVPETPNMLAQRQTYSREVPGSNIDGNLSFSYRNLTQSFQVHAKKRDMTVSK